MQRNEKQEEEAGKVPNYCHMLHLYVLLLSMYFWNGS